MKKQLVLISLILAMFTAYSQDATVQQDTVKKVKDSTYCHHRINLHFGGSVTNNIYQYSQDVDRIFAGSHLFEIGYTYMFNKTVGLGLGIGVQDLTAKLRTNLYGMVPGNVYTEQPDHQYNFSYKTTDLIERQHVFAIYVPLQVQFEHKFKGGKHGIYAGIGAQGYFPLIASAKVKDGTLTTKGDEEYLNVHYNPDMPQHGMSEYPIQGKPHKLYNKNKQDLRCSVDLLLDFGYIYEMNNKMDLYVGVFASYGFLDLMPKTENKLSFVEIDPTTPSSDKYQYNGILGSTYLDNYNTDLKTKYNLIQFGVKVGFHIKPCGKLNPSLKKRVYEKYLNSSNDPITDDKNKKNPKDADDANKKPVEKTEIIYIIPQCDAAPQQEPAQQPMSSPLLGKAANKDNSNMQELIDVLNLTKIYFDLDKDDPKVARKDESNINKVSEILKKDPSLILIVEGYTCPLGSKEHNRALAKRRAQNTCDYFISKGVPADQVQPYSYTAEDDASTRNIQSNANEEHRVAIFRIKQR